MPDSKVQRDNYTAIFSDYYPMVFNAVYTKIGNREDAEDVCQEVFIALYNNMDKIENIRKWLWGTLKNMLLKFYRDRSPGSANIDDGFNDVGLTFVNGFRDTRIMISSAIDDEVKDDVEMMLIDLIAFHNYSYNHVSHLLGLTKRKVEYRYVHLVNRIIDNLKKQGVKNIEDLL